jgi:prephenate dehydratase
MVDEQWPKKIAFQGVLGSNSDIACGEVYPEYEAVPCASFEDVFDEVESARADLAMIPIENSIAGRVADIHHLMRNVRLNIIGEHFLRVRHCLLGISDASLETVRIVESHEQALGQCHKFIRKHNLTARATSDTAGAALEISKAGDKSRAAIAPPKAAELYQLKVIAADIQDVMFNTTRFIILSREPIWAKRDAGQAITSFVFEVRNIAGSLYKALGAFATSRINMTKLESYMIDDSFSATEFYADIEGHPEDPEVAQAIEELAFFSKEMKILGVYTANEFRKSVATKLPKETEEHLSRLRRNLRRS